MKELLSQITQWGKSGKPFAMARVIQTWGSSPRPVGSALIISGDDEMAGSVSGGCVEGAVVKEARRVINNRSATMLSFGVTDDEAWSVGLSCGGKIKVYLQSFSYTDDVWKKLIDFLSNNQSCALITELKEGDSQMAVVDRGGNVIGASLPADILQKANEAFSKRKHELVVLEDATYFIQIFPARSRLIIIGAAHITADLVQLAAMHDFETWVIDPRGAFTNSTQFAVSPDHLLEQYPSEVLNNVLLDEYTYAVTLSHDPKIDDNALQILLRSNVAYVGALGSRKTHAKRIERLAQAGFSESEIARIESPVGIDIHALGAREIALSIMGSVIRVKNSFH